MSNEERATRNGEWHCHEIADSVLISGERFWEDVQAPREQFELLRYSFHMGATAFIGYFFSYVVVGQIWNWWPFVRTSVPFLRGVMCAGLQWIFFASFPMISSLVVDFLFSRSKSKVEFRDSLLIVTYSMAPLYLAALFVCVPYLQYTTGYLGPLAFGYLLYFGYRRCSGQTVLRSLLLVAIISLLFAFIRQMFVYVIGF